MWGGHIWRSGGGAPAGSRGRAPGQGVRGRSPLKLKPFSFWMPNGSSKFASFSVFCKLPKPQVFAIHLSTNWKVSSTMAWTILCINRKAVWNCSACDMCEVALQSKSAQIVAPNVCWETPLNHNSYTTEYPESLCLALWKYAYSTLFWSRTNVSAVTVSIRHNHPVKESNMKYYCRDLDTFLTLCLFFCNCCGTLKPISQLRFDYDTTTIRDDTTMHSTTTEVIEIMICARLIDCDTTRLRRKIGMFIFCSRQIASNGSRRARTARYVVVGS